MKQPYMKINLSKSNHKKAARSAANWLPNPLIFAILLSSISGTSRVNASEARNLPLSDLSSINAISASGSRFQVDLPDGTSCSTTNGTPPSLNLYSGYSLRSDKSQISSTSNGDGYAVGAVVTIPFFTSNSRNCDEAYALNIANKKLELATFMFQEDLLSETELRIFVEQIKDTLLLQ